MEEFKAKRHAVKKMTRKGLVETDSREGIVKETAEAKSDEQLGVVRNQLSMDEKIQVRIEKYENGGF